ncbi:hypothetical protein ACHAWF_015666 [Thalassiosira exigua]
MSKPPAKRKASVADFDSSAASGSIDLSNSKTKPRAVADALLALLPDGATGQSAEAKKLKKAFALVTATLDARSTARAVANESEGARSPIAFSFRIGGDGGDHDTDEQGGDTITIQIPEDAFATTLRFLKGREVVKVSLVNKAWLSASRSASLWEKLDDSCLRNSHKKLNMKSVLELLGRPQFSNLKFLAIPSKINLGKTGLKQISRLCPQLESLDVGYSASSGQNPRDSDLMEATERFTCLTGLRTNMWNATSFGISSVANAMGGRLLDLRICGDSITHHYLSDNALHTLAGECPNLKHFTYKVQYPSHYVQALDRLSGEGVVALVRGCRRLEVIELAHARNVRKDAFTAIKEMIAQDRGNSNGFALRKIDLKGYDFLVDGNPFFVVTSG